jgi:hypothetical protein
VVVVVVVVFVTLIVYLLLVTANVVPSSILVTLMMEAIRSSVTSLLTRFTRAKHPRRRHSSLSPPWKSQIFNQRDRWFESVPSPGISPLVALCYVLVRGPGWPIWSSAWGVLLLQSGINSNGKGPRERNANTVIVNKIKQSLWLWSRRRTIPTGRPLLGFELSANFCV